MYVCFMQAAPSLAPLIVQALSAVLENEVVPDPVSWFTDLFKQLSRQWLTSNVLKQKASFTRNSIRWQDHWSSEDASAKPQHIEQCGQEDAAAGDHRCCA
jgi:hypothetical protein